MQDESMKLCSCPSCQYSEKLFLSTKSFVQHEKAHTNTGMDKFENCMFQFQICKKDFTSKATLENRNSLAHKNSCSSNFNQNHGTNLVHRMKDHPMTQVEKEAELDPSKDLQIIESPNHPVVWTSATANRVESRIKVRGFKQPTLDGFVEKKNFFQSKQRQESNKPEYVCSICKTAFTFSQRLLRHKSTHLGDPQFHCKICLVKFNSLKALRFHTLQVHVFSAGSSKFKLPGRPGKNTKKPLIDIECQQSKDPIYVRQSVMEDPQLWPKVVMSRDLNDILMSHK